MAELKLSDLIDVTLVYDAALSPIETQPLGGKVVAVPRSLIPLPARGRFLAQAGFSRQSPGWEWVMTAEVDPLDAFVDGLTGLTPARWLVPASRTTVRTITQALLNRGFTRAQVATNMPALYNAVSAEVRAEIASP